MGIHILIRECLCRNRVAILMYHDAKSAVFARHIAYLLRHYTVISLDTLVSAIHQKDFSRIPAKSVVITIDDGHADNIKLLPLFKQYRICPTLFVCTQIVDTHRHFWFKVEEQSKAEREKLKRLPNVERLAFLKHTADFEPEKTYPERQALNIAEMKEMIADVDFQPHTQFHPILPHCTEAECRQEILGSKLDLEKLLDIECSHFSYPNGDYTEREIEIVKTAGFRSARTTDIGWNTQKTAPYRLRTVPIADDAGLTLFRAQLTTIPQRLNSWVNAVLP
ncbi:polysaccharide deacetylase family protein [Candidatus Poribacteria bacterium]|nr:polysaccharide deacetylase family protein [Candidatus Poribacteria bacterium]MXV85140.1 polysaccharide deacetylase family protein [Candidatus Poribacteria bacterium]MYA58114.1 polysaccharide deacetylase family protein [Candidatus Poribacteria bacterium]